jgi:hypothetical protein
VKVRSLEAADERLEMLLKLIVEVFEDQMVMALVEFFFWLIHLHLSHQSFLMQVNQQILVQIHMKKESLD